MLCLRNSISIDTQDSETSSQPSSRFVPEIKGRCANCPLANNFEGKSGNTPPNPSIVGMNPNNSGDSEMATIRPCAISLVLAACKQGKVFPLVARDEHDETPRTKFCQSIS